MSRVAGFRSQGGGHDRSTVREGGGHALAIVRKDRWEGGGACLARGTRARGLLIRCRYGTFGPGIGRLVSVNILLITIYCSRQGTMPPLNISAMIGVGVLRRISWAGTDGAALRTQHSKAPRRQ